MMVKRLPRWIRALFRIRARVWLFLLCLLYLPLLGRIFFPVFVRNWQSLLWVSAPAWTLLVYVLYFSFLACILFPLLFARHGGSGFSGRTCWLGRALPLGPAEERVRVARPTLPVFLGGRASPRRA